MLYQKENYQNRKEQRRKLRNIKTKKKDSRLGYKYNYNKISFTPKTAIETKLEEIEKKHEATN